MAVVGRRSAVVAAAAGLVVSTFGAPATAATSAENASSVPAVDTSALTASARAALETAPVVTVAADASWTLDVPAVTVVVDAPKPKPVTRTAAAASRSAARTAVPAAANSPVPQSVSGNAVLEVAARYVGVPYRSGGKTPEGFDCSGFTAYVYGQLGISMTSQSSAQRNVGTVVSRADALPGDLIWSPGHVAIYAGGNTQIDAPKPGGSVQFRAIWQSNPVFIRVS
ncbi:C40 family peptidase [Pengzhenrongella phosphoraccumulans]|jgi:peptidoglycan DL-endopeptidase CwlO|uniref:C40 family peptidase n=1 Tax=Pengzhenrongella phosphoraccumulans TaxID=3114394 RepID=UPI00388F4198